MATVLELQAQIDSLINSLSDPSEYEIDGAIKIKNKVADKLAAINALQLQIDIIEGDDYSPTSQSQKVDYEG